MEFTYKSYEQLICLCKEKNYNIITYNNVGSYSKEVILRHDVDFEPEKTLKIAEIEYDLGVTSTYFFLLRTDFYNVFSKKNQIIINKILNYGHDIGLHFDETFYDDCTRMNIVEHVENEAKSMSNAIGKKVNSISMHRPSKWLLDANIEFDGLINSYANEFFEEYKYVSDSRMKWRENPIDIIDKNKFDKVHILTHPFWYSSANETTRQKMLYFISESQYLTYNYVNNNFRKLDEFVKLSDVDGGTDAV